MLHVQACVIHPKTGALLFLASFLQTKKGASRTPPSSKEVALTVHSRHIHTHSIQGPAPACRQSTGPHSHGAQHRPPPPSFHSEHPFSGWVTPPFHSGRNQVIPCTSLYLGQGKSSSLEHKPQLLRGSEKCRSILQEAPAAWKTEEMNSSVSLYGHALCRAQPLLPQQ